MLDKPDNLFIETRTDGRIKVLYLILIPMQSGVGVFYMGIVEGELRQLNGKLVMADA